MDENLGRQDPPLDQVAGNALRHKHDDPDQQNAVHHLLGSLGAAQHFRKHRQKKRAQEGTGERSHAADHHDGKMQHDL